MTRSLLTAGPAVPGAQTVADPPPRPHGPPVPADPGTVPGRLSLAGESPDNHDMNPVVALGVAVASIAVGALVLRAHQARIGWLLVAHGVCFGALLTFAGTSSSHAGQAADQLAAGSWVFVFLWLVLAAYVVPDGHTLSPRRSRWVQLGLVGVVLFLVGSAGDVEEFR